MTDLPILAMLGPWEIVGILAIALLLFGSKKLPELARGLGTGLKEFKKATSDVSNELQRAVEEEPPTPQHRQTPPPNPRNYSAESTDSPSKESNQG